MSTDKQQSFLIQEFLYFSIQAGFATRNEDYPIYDNLSEEFSLKKTKDLRNDLKSFLLEYFIELKDKSITEEEHIKKIETLSKIITKKHGSILFESKFRIGVAQKIINLFLKYLWAADLISKPHHCPFDNIIKLKIQKHAKDKYLVDWTEMTKPQEYNAYVSAAKIASTEANMSISEWELSTWKRR